MWGDTRKTIWKHKEKRGNNEFFKLIKLNNFRMNVCTNVFERFLYQIFHFNIVVLEFCHVRRGGTT